MLQACLVIPHIFFSRVHAAKIQVTLSNGRNSENLALDRSQRGGPEPPVDSPTLTLGVPLFLSIHVCTLYCIPFPCCAVRRELLAKNDLLFRRDRLTVPQAPQQKIAALVFEQHQEMGALDTSHPSDLLTRTGCPGGGGGSKFPSLSGE